MLDLAPIRALLDIHMGRGASKAALHAHILAYEHLIPDLLSELDRLTAELAAAPEAARRWSAIREAVATVQAATGLGGDTPMDDDAVAELLSGALQNAARVHFAETALRTDAEANARTLEHHRRLFVGQQARAERAESELAATQAELTAAGRGPVVEWDKVGRSFVAIVGRHEMIVVPDNTLSVWPFGWQLSITGTQNGDPCSVVLDSGEETGPLGKSAAEAAYRKAAGL